MGHFQDDQEIEWHAARNRSTVADTLRREVRALQAEVAALREELGVFLACAEKVDCLARGLNARLRDKLARANDPTWEGPGGDG